MIGLSFDIDGMGKFRDEDEEDIFLEIGIPRIVEFLEKNRTEGTFFVVGNNVKEHKKVHSLLKKYEIGNHSLSHPYFLGLKNPEEQKKEILGADKIISDFYGKKIVGFRSPDYNINKNMIDILKKNNYRYDSSLIKVVYPFHYFRNYIRNRELARDKFELMPTSFILPFNGTTNVASNFSVMKTLFRFIKGINRNIVLVFHDRDFVNKEIGFRDFHMSNRLFGDRSKAYEKTVRFLNWIVKENDVLPLKYLLQQ